MTQMELLRELKRKADAMYHAAYWCKGNPWELEKTRVEYEKFLKEVYGPFMYQQEED